MAWDMEERGWHVVYAADVVGRCFPSGREDSRLRERRRIRNDIWLTWMRRPWRPAWRRTCKQLGHARLKRIFWRTLADVAVRSEEHTSELQSIMRISYAVFCLKKNK